jgi:hypothetical protein
MAEQLNQAQKKVADTFKAEWKGGFQKITVKVAGKVVKEISAK